MFSNTPYAQSALTNKVWPKFCSKKLGRLFGLEFIKGGIVGWGGAEVASASPVVLRAHPPHTCRLAVRPWWAARHPAQPEPPGSPSNQIILFSMDREEGGETPKTTFPMNVRFLVRQTKTNGATTLKTLTTLFLIYYLKKLATCGFI